MVAFSSRNLLGAALVAGVTASPVAEPAVTGVASLAKRASCTFTGSDGAASASASQKDCATIVLSDVAVPSGVTLDLSDLEDGTTVREAYACMETDLHVMVADPYAPQTGQL